MSPELYITNPLTDSRWDDFVGGHRQGSAFHCSGWLWALSRTYDYRPYVLTSARPNQPLRDGVAFCMVSSWATGTRLVSLPFSDHCEPLLDDPRDFPDFANWLRDEREQGGWKYAQLRTFNTDGCAQAGMFPCQSFYFHSLDLDLSLESLFSRLHKDSIQRKIRRAERENLTYEAGRSKQLSEEFYRLLLMTRRRHHLLPQPKNWFANLIKSMGRAIEIRVARKENVAIAAMLTIRHGATAMYKYGCSDERFHPLGGMPFLFWKFIEECKIGGVETIDFGRSDLSNEGLISFKDKFGTQRRLLTYHQYPAANSRRTLAPSLQKFFSMVPESVSSLAGSIVYRHMG